MKIGLLAFVTTQSVDPASLAKNCESLGFESFYLPEHPIIPVKHKTPYPLSKDGEIPEPYAQMVDPFVGLALAAAATTTIGLGTGICLVPERHPIVLAKEVATLDYTLSAPTPLNFECGGPNYHTELLATSLSRPQFERPTAAIIFRVNASLTLPTFSRSGRGDLWLRAVFENLSSLSFLTDLPRYLSISILRV